MKLLELFKDNKIPWKWSFTGSEECFAEFNIGGIEYNFHVYTGDSPNSWEVQFAAMRSVDGDDNTRTNYGLTNTGNSAQVLTVVLEIIKAFIDLYGSKIESLHFSAKEGSRKSLYMKMVQRLAPGWDFKKHGEYFTLFNPAFK